MSASPPRRILMTTDAVGGVWVYASSLARALCQRGDRVTLVVLGPAPTMDQLLPLHSVPGLDVEVTDLALEWMDPEATDAGRARAVLLSIADRVQPDIVHLNSYREASFDWPAPVLVVAHSCVLSWWQACRAHTPIDSCWRSYTAGVARALRDANVWAAPTRAFRSIIEAVYRPPLAGRVIWNGVDMPAVAAPKQPFVLAAGRLWDEAKNLGALLAIAPKLDWPLRLIGPRSLSAPAAAGRLGHNAEHLGTLSHAATVREMRRAAIFVSPAVYEPFGLTVLEAAACGCALALADLPSFRELWDGAAIYFDPHDGEALLATLQRFSRDAELRCGLQQAAAVRARRYSQAATTLAYRALYDEILAAGGARAASFTTAAMEMRA